MTKTHHPRSCQEPTAGWGADPDRAAARRAGEPAGSVLSERPIGKDGARTRARGPDSASDLRTALRRLRLDAHRGLGRPVRHPRARRPCLRHAAPLRAGHRPRAAPPVVRPQRRRPLRRRVRPTSSASRSISPPSRCPSSRRNRARRCWSRRHPGAGCVRDPLPPRGGLPRRAAGRAPHGQVRRRRDAGADPRSGRPPSRATRGSSAKGST